MNCPNKSHPDWKELVRKIGVNDAYLEFYKNGMDIPDPALFKDSIKGVNAGLKILEAVTSEKGQQLFNRFYKGNKEKYFTELTQLAGKNQVALLRTAVEENSFSSIGDLVSHIANEMSYTVEIKLGGEREYEAYNMQEEYEDDGRVGTKPPKPFSVINQEGTNQAFFDTREEAEEHAIMLNRRTPSTTYSNLTVPGGTNYEENEIGTPAITPSILGHAQFSTRNGIGWFRSDEQVEGGAFLQGGVFEGEMVGSSMMGGSSTKSRRILELQSDLFQKGRNKEDLTKTKGVNVDTDIANDFDYEGNNYKYSPITTLDTNETTHLYLKNGNRISKEEYEEARGKLNSQSIKDKNQNSFLQLLNKDNNWVNYFVKAIIQDSHRKSYEKVLFPKGDTASKIEGHTTLEGFRREKENRIKILKEEQKIDYKSRISKFEQPFGEDLYRVKIKEIESQRRSREELEQVINEYNSGINNEIKQLEQELERVEREGFAALRPIYNFYENIVTNVLRKQGFNPVVVTDEHGNKWNEITLSDNSSDEFYFSNATPKETTDLEKERDKNIKQIIVNFLEVNEIKYEDVEAITDREGNKLPAIAIANLFDKAVRVLKGQDRPEILGEEAGHILVELLGENSPLYQSMYNEITQYKIYQDVVGRYGELPTYKGNEKKLRKEAIGQLIGQIIAGNIQDQEKQDRIERWWNRALRYLKERVNSLFGLDTLKDGIVEYNPFSEAAKIIMNEQNLSNISEFKREYEDETYFALDQDKQNQVVNDLQNKHQLVLDGDSYYVVQGSNKTKVPKRVSNRVEADSRKRFPKERGEMEKMIDDIKKKYGTKGHKDVQNIIDRAVAERTGGVAPARQHSLPDDLYNTLEKHFTEFIKGIPADAKIFTEKIIFDSKQNEAGTIDLLVIYNDGSVGIFDWKFIDFGKRKQIAWYKRIAWEIQLPRYRQILRDEYGVTKFRETRVIPISARYKNNELVGLEIADANVKAIPDSQDYLKPVPVFDEMTGVESLDRTIKSLLTEKDKWTRRRPSPSMTPEEADAFKSRRAEELDRIQKAIRDIQVGHDLSEYIERGVDLLKSLKSVNLAEMDLEEMLSLIEKLKHYGTETIKMVDETTNNKTEEQKKNLLDLSSNAQVYEGRFERELARRIVDKVGEEGLEPRKEKGWIGRNILDLSKQDDPLIQAFWDLVKRSKTKTRDKLDKTIADISEVVKQLEKEHTGSGGLYDDFIKEKKNGELAIIDKFSPEFYEKLSRARTVLKETHYSKEQKARAKKWIQDNTEFNKEEYERRLKSMTLAMERLYSDRLNKDELVHKRVEEWTDFWGNGTLGLANERNENISLKDNPANYSDEYKKVNSSPTKKKFYDMWMKYNREFIKITDLDKRGNFIWNIPNNIIEQISESGAISVLNKNTMMEQLYLRQGNSLGNVDENGRPIKSIPVYYHILNSSTDSEGNVKVDNRNQSRNLGSVLAEVANMAYNHKHLSEIETDTNLLLYAMSIRKTLPRTSKGGVIRDEVTGELKNGITSSADLEQLQDYVNYYLYGVKMKTTDASFTVLGKEFSALAAYNLIAKSFVGKALAFNPLSIVANSVGGTYNALIIGASGRLFTNKDFNAAISYELPSRNKTAYSFVGYVDLLGRDDSKRKIRGKLSINKLTEHLTYDNLFIGQRAGDWWIRNGVLLAMAKKYRVEDGKIVRIPVDDKSTTLYNYFKENTKGDELQLDGLQEGEMEKFVNAVHHTSELILGNNNRDAIALVNLTVAGKALTMFRSWMPATFSARYGSLKFNKELGIHEQGRYRTFFRTVWDKKVLSLSKEMVQSFGVFGYGGKVGQTTREHAKSLYAAAIVKNPNLKLTEEEFIEIHIANLRSMMAELYSFLSIVGLIFLAAPDDDETLEQGSMRRYTSKQLERIKMELASYWHPKEFDGMLRNPIPMTNIYVDIKRLGYSVIEAPYMLITGQGEDINPTKARGGVTRIVPVLSGVEQVWSFIDETYDKTYKQLDK